jgi:amidase
MTLKDIIAFNEVNMSDYAPYNHEIILQAATESFDEDKLKEQIQINQKITQESLDALLEDYDCLITLSNYMTSVYAPAGYPALTIPAGYRSENEPIGITFIGKKGDDVKLMNIGLGYETLTKHRQPPEVKS